MDLMVIRRAIATCQLMAMQIQPTLFVKIREAQWRSQVARIQETSGSRVEVRYVDPYGWNTPFW